MKLEDNEKRIYSNFQKKDKLKNWFFQVMYLRMATGPDSLPCAYAYIEFSQQPSVPVALQNNGLEFEGRPLKIVHSRYFC